jgi:hypothetical protein
MKNKVGKLFELTRRTLFFNGAVNNFNCVYLEPKDLCFMISYELIEKQYNEKYGVRLPFASFMTKFGILITRIYNIEYLMNYKIGDIIPKGSIIYINGTNEFEKEFLQNSKVLMLTKDVEITLNNANNLCISLKQNDKHLMHHFDWINIRLDIDMLEIINSYDER